MNEKKQSRLIGNLVLAKDLRKKEIIEKIPKDKPGWYKWWAPKKALVKLLNSKYLDKEYLDILLPKLTTEIINGNKYYYIYVGITESIRGRLNWHVNQHHTKPSVENGFLSTLRKSISSLVSENQFAEKATNELINMLIIEYYTINSDINPIEAKDIIEEHERTEIEKNVLPLNIKENKNELLKDYKKQLKLIRKKTRNKVKELKEIEKP